MAERTTRSRRDALLLTLAAAAAFLAVHLALAAFTGQWPLGVRNQYNSYTLQALAWLDGRLDLGQDYPWLELAIYEGRYYVSFPPFPSLVMLPFAAVLGENTPDALIALAAALIAVYHACALANALRPGDRGNLPAVLFLTLCNGWLFLTLNGWVWFIAQNLCFALMLAALHHAVRGRGGLSLAAWACAVGCRPMCALFLPLMLLLLADTVRAEHPDVPLWKLVLRRWHWALVPLALAAFYMALNQARFGSPLEFGHNWLPEFQRAAEGQFSFSYLPVNLQELLTPPLALRENGAVAFTVVGGSAFWLFNPIFITAFAAWVKGLAARRGSAALAVLVWLSVLAYVAVLLCHRTLGGWQFGNRYLTDVMPVLFLGLLVWQPGERFRRAVLPYALLGAALNLMGTAAAYNFWLF